MHDQPRLTLRWQLESNVSLAILWEICAPKVGNVHRGADFPDASFVDFATAAVVVAPLVADAATEGVGRTVLSAAQATADAVATNTNLGTLLLLAPLAAAAHRCDHDRTLLQQATVDVLEGLTVADTENIYAAIRVAQPGGLGSVREADVLADAPRLTPQEVMRLASHRDTIARQYVDGFQAVFDGASCIRDAASSGLAPVDAIVHGQLQMMAQLPDSLIARKAGDEVARVVSTRAARVLAAGPPTSGEYRRELEELDFWLRSSGTQRNPGTTADLIAAALFVLLWRREVDWPVDFYGAKADAKIGRQSSRGKQ